LLLKAFEVFSGARASMMPHHGKYRPIIGVNHFSANNLGREQKFEFRTHQNNSIFRPLLKLNRIYLNNFKNWKYECQANQFK
jgi:hypothetical protein